MIYYSTPYLKGNIGGGINAWIETLPDDAWICLRDGDTLLFPGWGDRIEELSKTGYDLIGCLTNRVGVKHHLVDGHFSNIGSISAHKLIAEQVHSKGTEIKEIKTGPIAGFFMLFNKKLWQQIGGFEEETIYFDAVFTAKAREKNAQIGVAQGLYVFHLYRWGSDDPRNDIKHLQ